jgi:hypothetical protein
MYLCVPFIIGNFFLTALLDEVQRAIKVKPIKMLIAAFL